MTLISSCLARVAPVAATATLLLAAFSAQAADLTVHVQGVRSTQGKVLGSLYAAPADWLKQDRAIQTTDAPAAQPDTVLRYRGLAPGRYAVSVFQDENGNGQLDTNAVGLPTEPYGFSRDARGHMGPARFDAAAVEVSGDTDITIHLH